MASPPPGAGAPAGPAAPQTSQSDPKGPETADGTLVVIVCRAKHLPNRRKLDKQCPYVTCRIGPTAQKTPSHFRAGQTPEWTHEIRFQLTRERRPIMKLDVLDETKNEPTPIGQCEINCLIVFGNPANKQAGGKYIHDDWYELECNGRRAGKVFLEMTFYPSAPVLPPKVPTGPFMGSFHQTLATSGPEDANRHHSLEIHAGEAPQDAHRAERAERAAEMGYLLLLAPGPLIPDASEYSTAKLWNERQTPPEPGHGHSQSSGSGSGAMARIQQVFQPNQHSSTSSTTYSVDIKNGAVSPESKSRFNKLSKLKLKFQSKQPITSLYDGIRSRSPEKEGRPETSPNSRARPLYQLPKLTTINYSDDEDDDAYQPQFPVVSSRSDAAGDQEHYRRSPSPSGPAPPPHRSGNFTSGSSTVSSNMFSSQHLSSALSALLSPFVQSVSHETDTRPLNSSQNSSSSRSPGRKPPPPMKTGEEELSSRLRAANLNVPSTTAIPFSADTFGLDEDDSASRGYDVEATNMMPTLVYLLDKQVQSLSYRGGSREDEFRSSYHSNPHEIDPKYYAPTPTQHLSKTMRLQGGHGTRNDVQVDLRTESSGYLGDGKWQQHSKFSPLVFDRMPGSVTGETEDEYDDENKPTVPPKVPKGLTEIEYYVLEKEKYLKDINGRRA